MTYCLITYGCQMNHSDSERIATILEQIGYKKTNKEKSANLIIVNACSVRQAAIDRVYGKINNFNLFKHKPKTVLTGCILEKDKKKLRGQFDLILDIKDLPRLPQLLQKINLSSPRFHSGYKKNYFAIVPKNKSPFIANIPISTGCNNYCTYCVVPYVRGPEKNRPAKEIICEAKRHIADGAKEIWLLGQNVNSYRGTMKNSIINFPKLLKIINDLPGDFWIKFISSHPKDVSDELIKTVAQGDKICKYIHLPVQSGDNTILKKMNRHYTVTHYKNLIKKIRQQIPKATISTDIIIGFPNETEKQFSNTAKLMREVKFDMAYLSQYSPRPETAAAKLNDNVSKKEKKRREEILNNILRKTALENNKKYLGKTVNVLIEKAEKNLAFGKTATHKNVKITLDKINSRNLIGQLIPIKITSTKPWNLSGELTNY